MRLVLRAVGSRGPRQALGAEEVPPCVRQTPGRAERERCGHVEFGLEAVRFGRFGEVAVGPQHVVNRLTALCVAPDVLRPRPVVTVGDEVRVQAAPSWRSEVATAYLEHEIERPPEQPRGRGGQGADGAMVVQAAGVVTDARVEVAHVEAKQVGARAE